MAEIVQVVEDTNDERHVCAKCGCDERKGRGQNRLGDHPDGKRYCYICFGFVTNPELEHQFHATCCDLLDLMKPDVRSGETNRLLEARGRFHARELLAKKAIAAANAELAFAESEWRAEYAAIKATGA